ncbi:MAG: M14 family metallopeptidase [Planctomycetota bacterium]
MVRWREPLALPALLIPGFLFSCRMPPAAPPEPLRTVPEQSGYTRTSSHAEVLSFLDALEAAGDARLFRTRFGATPEGRELPLVVVADPPVRSPGEARASGKPCVLVMADIHAGEVEGKEACLELLRSIVWPGEEGPPYPLDKVVLLVAPIYNADGNDRLGPNHRPGQNGPFRVGVRTTSKGLDLNRDYLKLENQEAQALVRLFREWDPHVVVDLHTTNGSAHGYELTSAPPLNPSVAPRLLDRLENDWLPLLRRRMRERHGFETFDYGNFVDEEGRFQDEESRVPGWRTFDHRPRFGNNYEGLRNRLGILSEAYAYADFPIRIAVTRAFVTEILRLAAERGSAIPAFCRELDQETAASGSQGKLVQATAVEMVARGEAEPVLQRTVVTRTDTATGTSYRVAAGSRRTLELPCFVRFRATRTRNAPRAYFLPPEEEPLARQARLHGLEVRVLERPLTARVEVHRVARAEQAPRPFQGHRLWKVEWEVAREERTFPAGSFEVPVGQALGRVAFQLLDPEADDGLVVWGFLDARLENGPGTEIPVYGKE